MPRLQASAPARVVQVSSEAHQMGDLDVEDLDWDLGKRGKYNAMKQYSNTKLMNVVYANELTRRYKVRLGCLAGRLGRTIPNHAHTHILTPTPTYPTPKTRTRAS